MSLITPPGSPCGSPCGSPFGSPCDFQILRFPETPPRALFRSDDEVQSPLKVRKISESESRPFICPEAPMKQKKSKGPIKGLPTLTNDSCILRIDDIGDGSFGTVFSVRVPGSPSNFAMKEINVSGRSSPNDLLRENANFGKPGCVPGFAMSSPNGDKCYLFSPICDPLDKTDRINTENIDEINALMHDSIMKSSFSIITDANLSNMGIARAGTPTPILGENGLPCAGEPIPKDSVLFIDIGNNGVNDCNPLTSALFDEHEMNTEEEQLQYRKFKCELLTALLRNRIQKVPRNEYDIAREICDLYGYVYAGGNRR